MLTATRLRHYLGSSVLLALAIACGGTSESSTQSGGGSSSGGASGGKLNGGGSSSGGAAAGGSVGDTAGVWSGGNNSAGVGGAKSNTGGSVGQGGTRITIGGGGAGGSGLGGGTVDERCPDRLPTAIPCTAGDAGVMCQYDIGTGCLCYTQAPGAFLPCQKVDPTCGTAGAGGISAKIALPPRQVCSCSASSWTCTFGG